MAGGQAQRRVALNTYLADIADAQRIVISYRGSDGDSLKALVLLPANHRPGVRLPLVTDVYAGRLVGDSGYQDGLEKWAPAPHNLHLLAARGYAVLVPSMPLAPWGSASDPATDLVKGVLPAVDKAIDLGIADPARLGVMGISYGGYSTYALVTYTPRFRAAVALAAPANLISEYGTFFTPTRYDRFAHEGLFFVAGSEGGNTAWGRVQRRPLALLAE